MVGVRAFRSEWLSAGLLGCLLAAFCSPAHASSPKVLDLGRELFTRPWRGAGAEERGGQVGPMFNARSCAECHNQGGTGGAGDAERNVLLVTATVPSPTTLGAGYLGEVHPELSPLQPTTVLHRFSEDSLYPAWRDRLLVRAEFQPRRPNPESSRTHLELTISQRNTPTLRGSGLIERIDAKAIQSVLEWQKQRHPQVAGALPQGERSHAGRFGWRGQIGSLRDFVEGACAIELGLEISHPRVGCCVTYRVSVPRQRPSPSPLQPDWMPAGPSMTRSDLDAMTAFVASLPPPQRKPARDERHLAAIKRGEQLFETIGCAVCHVPQLGHARGIYSDLLLHDMGPDLADVAVHTSYARRLSLAEASKGAAEPNGAIALDRTRLWRTPPLWGVGDTAPYLHDGRATTLHDAIALHGGQAAYARDRYLQLDRAEQADLVEFLQVLGAPQD